MSKIKKECCEKFLKKPAACKSCPVLALVPKSKRKKIAAKLHCGKLKVEDLTAAPQPA